MSSPAPATAPKPIRSPSYPNMSLREAVDEVGKIERLYRNAPVDRTAAAKLIGYSSLSGPANKALAALASYGLLDRAGKGETRVTERARDILHAANPEQRRQRLIDAALDPELFRELRERFEGIPVPPEDGVVTYLNRQGFNPNAVRPAAKAFLDTMSYLQELGVSESHGADSKVDQSSTPPAGETPEVKYGGAAQGDLVQWEIDKVLQLEKAARVRAVQTHEGKEWVFVDGSETGMPMDQVIVEQKGPAQPGSKGPTLALPKDEPLRPGMRKEVFDLDEGEVVLTFPESLSATSFEDLDAYLKVFIAKMRRRAANMDKTTNA